MVDCFRFRRSAGRGPDAWKAIAGITRKHRAAGSLESGVARLVGSRPDALSIMLEEAYRDGSWASQIARIENPFGKGDSGRQIAEIIQELIGVGSSRTSRTAIL